MSAIRRLVSIDTRQPLVRAESGHIDGPLLCGSAQPSAGITGHLPPPGHLPLFLKITIADICPLVRVSVYGYD